MVRIARLTVTGMLVVRCGINLKGMIMGANGLPMFHALGSFMYSAAVSIQPGTGRTHLWTLIIGLPILQPISGFVIGVFKPSSPPIVPTPDVVWKGISNIDSDFSWSVPSFIQVRVRACMRNVRIFMTSSF